MTVQSLGGRRPYIVLIIVLMGLCQSCVAGKAKRAALESEMKHAMDQVRDIVNQPVQALARTSDMQASTYSPGWFHAGASRPDYNRVDVRTTQDLNYGKNEFVTSNITPGLVWLGSQLEFNTNTKYFYTDYSVPKKKLTENEMLEINRLYRIIGNCEEELAKLGS